MSYDTFSANGAPSPEVRRHILATAKTIAVVGLSDNQWKPSYGVSEYMQDAGYEIIPVNPNRLGKLILGEPVYATLADIPKPIDVVNVFRPAQVTPKIAEQAVAIGAKVLWLQLGIANDEAARIALEGGLTVVMNRCISTDHGRLFNS
jgi:predicted CoA-binding protein